MTFDINSHFLDIGSGLGKSVLHLVMATGCRGTGMEIVDHRINQANKFLQRLVDKNAVPNWVRGRVQYVKADAAENVKTPITIKGKHPSHIFMFSRVFSKGNLTAIARRLDLTDYKVLVCCVDHSQMITGVFPLKSGVELEQRI